MVDSLKGHDFLQLWNSRNGEEIFQHEMNEYKERDEYNEGDEARKSNDAKSGTS